MTGSHGLQRLADALGSGNRVNLDWLDEARCRDRYEIHDGKRFEMKEYEWEAPRANNDAHVRAMRTVCASCPVRQPCLLWALSSPHSIEFGVYAGSVGNQRMALRNDARIVERLTVWFEGWRKASDRVAYERRNRVRARQTERGGEWKQ